MKSVVIFEDNPRDMRELRTLSEYVDDQLVFVTKPEEALAEVSNLFPDNHYYTDYKCPVCGGEVVDAMQCEICDEWLPEDLLTDTTEYINGGVGYCCEGCMQDADMRAI